MKKTFSLLFLLLSLNSTAALESYFPSSVDGLDIPNAHWVENSYILRGQTPRNKMEYEQLKNLGVGHVIIFKNQTKNEVVQELKILSEIGIKATHIDFPWKNITGFAPVCEKALTALKILKNNNDRKMTTFFHCTVGEDRTGLLAGLMLQVVGANRDLLNIHDQEMCQKGFGAGNPQKHWQVAKTVRENLIPVYLKMSYLLKKSNYILDLVNCDHEFDTDKNFHKTIYSKTTHFSCQSL